MMNDSPIFVVGTPRSGTTLTAQILGRHPSILMPGENHFFEDIYARRGELGDPADPETIARVVERISTIYGRYNQLADQEHIDGLIVKEALIQRLVSASQTYKDVLDGFMKIQLEQYKGKRRWGNNTPKDLFHIKEILSFYPDAKILVCTRDVRDFLLSYKNRWMVTTDAHKERLRRLYHPVLTSMLWKASMKRIALLEAQIPKKNFMVVRYEDLVMDTEAVVKKICRVVDESFAPEMLEVCTHNSSDNLVQHGIFSSSIGKWRSRLEPEDAYVAQWISRKELTPLGYEQETLDIKRIAVLKLILSFPFAAIRAFRANTDNRGPALQYLVKRMSAILFGR